MSIIKIKCKVCGSEKSKWATCKNEEAHTKLYNERREKEFGTKQIFKQIFPENWFSGTHHDAAILSK